MLKSLFAEHSIVNSNTQIHVFDAGDYAVSILPPVVAPYVQIVVLLLLQMGVSILLSIIMYYGVLHSNSKSMAFVVAFVIVIPVALVTPFCWIEWWDIRSRAFRMGLVCLPSIMTFKCLECLFGFTPSWVLAVTRNENADDPANALWLYVQRTGFILWPKLDADGNRPLPATFCSLWEEIKGYARALAIGTVAHSLLGPYNYAPFPSSQDATAVFIAFSSYQLANNFLAAMLVGHSLSLSMHGISLLAQTLGGCQTEPITNNPLLASASPSDFWSNRWNQLIHTGLKQGVYKPVRFHSGSKELAALTTFIVSGLFHEYVWFLMFRPNSHEDANAVYVPNPLFGKSMLFFGWNGLLVVAEHAIGRERWQRHASKYPKPLVTLVVIMTALPMGHLFTGDMVTGGYFAHVQLYFPLLRIASRQE